MQTTKPPTDPPPSQVKTPRQPRSQSPDSSANLKNDLALQRLLQESHILRPSPSTSSQHAQTLSHRLQALQPSNKPPPLQKMPLSHRKGIVAKSLGKAEKRRREAKENGIILEKIGKQGGVGGKRVRERERGIGGPNIGRFKGGTLKLSRKDIVDIEGPRSGSKAIKTGGGKGKRR